MLMTKRRQWAGSVIMDLKKILEPGDQ